MESSPSARQHRGPMSIEAARRRSTWLVLGVLGAAMAGVVTTHLVGGASLVDVDGLHDAVLAGACVLSAGVILWRRRSAGLLRSPPLRAFGILALAAVSLVVEANDFRYGVSAPSPYDSLVLWVASVAHIGQFGMIAAFSAGAVVFAEQWVRGTYTSGRSAVDLPLALGALGLAFVVTAAPRRMGDGKVARPSRYGRALLTTVAVATACAALGLV